MLIRIISGVIGAIIVIAVVLFNNSLPFLLNIIISLSSMLSIFELFNAIGMRKNYRIFIPSILFAGIVPLIQNQMYEYVWSYIYTLTVFVIVLFFNGDISVKDSIVSFSLTSLISWAFHSLVLLRNFGDFYGGFFVLIALGAAWYADTGGYFCGLVFGKHKLCESISPKKTVEGAIGGLVFNIVFLNFTALVFKRLVFLNSISINYFSVTLIALICSAISIVGDLSFSIVKRSCNIKDFGAVIPGHGGILDRFDSVIFVAPCVSFLIRFFPIIS